MRLTGNAGPASPVDVAFTVTADSFPSLVRREFAYLVDDFSCSVQEKLYGAEPFSDGVIEFWCDKVVISVQLDRFDVIVSIRPPSEPLVSAKRGPRWAAPNADGPGYPWA